jgi:hypothetical protein
MKVKPIETKYIYFFTSAELYQVSPYAKIGGPEQMSHLPLGTWERINVSLGRFITGQDDDAPLDLYTWYQVVDDFDKAHLPNTYPALIGPTKQVHGRHYAKDEQFAEDN